MCNYILLISDWLFIRLNDAFVFSDPEPPIINILYGWSGIYGHFKLCCVFFFICVIIKIDHHYIYFFILLISFMHGLNAHLKRICSIFLWSYSLIDLFSKQPATITLKLLWQDFAIKQAFCVFLTVTISLSHLLKAFVSCGYFVILSSVCNLLSSLQLSAILLTCSVYTLWQSLLNFYCEFSMILSLNE